MNTIQKILLLSATVVLMLAQNVTIGPIEVRGESPLHPKPCANPHIGYLHIDLTPEEIGQYVKAETEAGKIITVYPISRSGMFFKETCSASAP
jgi:hypothetical protein